MVKNSYIVGEVGKMKYFYWFLLAILINSVIIFSYIEKVVLSFEIGTLVTGGTTIMWHYFNKFWTSYEKSLDSEL